MSKGKKVATLCECVLILVHILLPLSVVASFHSNMGADTYYFSSTCSIAVHSVFFY